jgi:hypothetical protein
VSHPGGDQCVIRLSGDGDDYSEPRRLSKLNVCGFVSLAMTVGGKLSKCIPYCPLPEPPEINIV